MRRSYRRRPFLARLIHPTWIVRPLLIALFLAGSLGLVWVRTQVRDARYRLTELEWEFRSVNEEQQELRMRKAVLSSPARIEKAARKVGLGLADRSRIFIMPNEPVAIHVSHAPGAAGTRAPRS